MPQEGSPAPFFPDGTYDSRIPTPQSVLGLELGAKPVRHAQVEKYLTALAASSPQVLLREYGSSYEGRKLYYILVGSPENISRIDEIQKDLAQLADPRKIPDAQADRLVGSLPAVAWMAYSIHGDELSSTDAALQVAYQLAAGTDPLTQKLRENLVVIIDPLQNPDGRERILSQIESFSGKVISWDVQSLQHSGMWPWGRGNHYLFDLNRDWFALVHPESRGKTAAILSWNPQLVVDCHEMGSFDTYLFSPPRKPFNPYWSSNIHKWWKKFSSDQARAFDRYGWSYYTREWNEEWFPGYGSSWSIFLGAVGILYEQAGVSGSQVKRHDRSIMTYRETVHHQFVSSIANLTTAAENRRELLEDFYQEKKRAVESKPVTYLFVPGQNETRTRDFIQTMLKQKIEVSQAEESFTTGELTDIWQNHVSKKTFPKGTYLISSAQPLSHLVKVILDFDIRIPTDFLEEEREDLEMGKGTKLYEITSWSVPLAFGLNAYRTEKTVPVKSSPVASVETAGGSLQNPEPDYGYLFDYASEGGVLALARLLEKDFPARVALKPFAVEGSKFPAGTILLRKQECSLNLKEYLRDLADQYGVQIRGVNTALAEDGADLGGSEFELLQKPRVAVVTNNPVNFTDFGTIWHLLDQRLEIKFSNLDILGFSDIDLSHYNVIIFPSSWGGSALLTQIIGKGGISKLKEWVQSGGTLIAIENSAVFVADSAAGLSQVKLKDQVLDSLSEYREELERLTGAEKYEIDSLDLWEARKPATTKAKSESPNVTPQAEKEIIRKEEERGRLFMPRGAILRVDLDTLHWLSYGLDRQVPVLVYAEDVFVSKQPVQTAGRFAPGENLRLSGLLWPEARKRWENTSYLTREQSGKGQIILFASHPNFRGYFRGAERLLINAFLLGPGVGTSIPREW
ncbi:MAG: M14 family metallopeptidase [candidate division Zixibacteria bacterium]|nr:M14 family metallopeptidase [candidate division Zixibacteria bacterium]